MNNGGDYFANTPPVVGTLRAAVEGAQAGDTITIAEGLVVYLQDHLTITDGQDNLTITGPETGAAEIRTKIRKPRFKENVPAFSQAVVNVLGDGVKIRKVTLRDIALTIGSDDAPQPVQGGTVQDCRFMGVSWADFENMNGGVLERCNFNVSNPRPGGSGAISVDHGDGVIVRDSEVTIVGARSSETALGVSFTENALVENVTLTNGDIYFHPRSGTLRINKLPSRVIDMNLYQAIQDGGPYLVEGNECGAISIQARNFTVRDNTISGRVIGRTVPSFDDLIFFSLNMIAIDSTLPLLIEGNDITGGANGATLSIDAGSAGATIRDNAISNVKRQGLRVHAEAPVEVSENVFEKCGNPLLGIPGSFPVPALYLRKAAAAVLVRENTFRNSRGAAIVAGDGSPVFDTNRITRGVANGFIFHDGVTPAFVGNNVIELMGRAGVLVKPGAVVTVEHATFDGNAVAGISVEPGGRVTARDNLFTGQRGSGIKLADKKDTALARATVDACAFTKNVGAGILIGKGAEAEVIGSSFTDNAGPGIDIFPAGVTPNARPKLGNGDIDFPEQVTFNDSTRQFIGHAEAGALVRLYRTEDNKRRGNPKNGEGVKFVASTTATGNGDFMIASGPTREGDLFTFTATRPGAQPLTSEFSENIAVPPSPPIDAISVSSNEEAGNQNSTAREPSDGGQLTLQSAGDTISSDGRFVVFSSKATNLVNDDTNATHDVFVRDRANGTTERVNVSTGGAQAARQGGNLLSGSAAISANGRWVVFSSNATNLVPGDGNNSTDVFLRDRETNTTSAVTDPTQRPDTTYLNGGWDPAISADGSTIAFVTVYRDFVAEDTNDAADIYVRARTGGIYERVSLAADGSQIPAGVQFNTGVPRLSGDGRFVVFQTAAKLVTADTNSLVDVYLRDRQTNTTELITRNAAGNAVGGTNHTLTPDGRYVAFTTSVSLDAADTNSVGDIYVLDRSDGSMHFASQPPAGGFGGFNPNRIFPSLSADGRYVAFQGDGRQEPPVGLTTLDWDIYVRDRQLGVTIKVSVGGDGVARSGRMPAISADGSTVLFQTDRSYLPTMPSDFTFQLYTRSISPDDFAAP